MLFFFNAGRNIKTGIIPNDKGIQFRYEQFHSNDRSDKHWEYIQSL